MWLLYRYPGRVWRCFVWTEENEESVEKLLEAKTNDKLNPTWYRAGIEPGPHWWEASVITTVPSIMSQIFVKSVKPDHLPPYPHPQLRFFRSALKQNPRDTYHSTLEKRSKIKTVNIYFITFLVMSREACPMWRVQKTRRSRGKDLTPRGTLAGVLQTKREYQF